MCASSRGAARGIGRAIAEALLDEGARVCLADMNADQAAEAAAASRARPRCRIPEAGGHVRRWSTCATGPGARILIGQTRGPVRPAGRVMFNNAGVQQADEFSSDVTDDNWRLPSWM